MTLDARGVSTIEITDPLLLRIGQIAHREKIDVYVVGGYVRDAIMGRPRTDIDITVVGDPLLFARTLAKEFQTHTVEYERFRTALIPIGNQNVEVVGTRSEVYAENSRKPVVQEGTLLQDIQRRDFTVNTLAASLNPEHMGEITDMFSGVRDIKLGVLKTPLEPTVTMQDDPLRMMRAARFASQLGFAVDDELYAAIQNMAHRISVISQERISDEFLKILATPKPSIGLGILFGTGLMKHIFPEVHNLEGVEMVSAGSREFKHKDVFWHTLKVVDNVAEVSNNVWLRFATLMHDIAKPRTKRFVEGTGWTFHGHEEVGARWQEKIFRRMKLPMHHLHYVETLVRLHQRPMKLVDEGVTDSAVRRLAVQAGEHIEDLFMLCRADVTTRNATRASKYLRNYDTVQNKILDVQERDNLRAFQSPLRGEEIMQLAELQPCRAVGYMKWMIEEAILDGIIPNEYGAAKEYFLQHKNLWLQQADTAIFGRRGGTDD